MGPRPAGRKDWDSLEMFPSNVTVDGIDCNDGMNSSLRVLGPARF
jgi:hypothetical protein